MRHKQVVPTFSLVSCWRWNPGLLGMLRKHPSSGVPVLQRLPMQKRLTPTLLAHTACDYLLQEQLAPPKVKGLSSFNHFS